MTDLEKTIHYTTKAQEICANLIRYIPEDAILVEPFVGDGNLISLFPNHTWERYDIEEKPNATKQDTLLQPPVYINKWVITNPPYLAKNKAKEKTIFNKYDVDDLYKATLLSILDCEGGILIIPTNFITDERTGAVRKKFLSQFEILEMNVFTRPVFETTTYSVCSFAFKRTKDVQKEQNFYINIKPKEEQVKVSLLSQYDFRLAGDFFDKVQSVKIQFGRLVGSTSKDYITNIHLYGLDTRENRIRVEYDEKPYEGKNTDRIYATLTCKCPLTKEEELRLIERFNEKLEQFRKTYYDLPMTNYRDYDRKRISFTFAYQLMSIVYNEIKGG